jgi:hypothetical protein
LKKKKEAEKEKEEKQKNQEKEEAKDSYFDEDIKQLENQVKTEHKVLEKIEDKPKGRSKIVTRKAYLKDLFDDQFLKVTDLDLNSYRSKKKM